MPSKLEEAKRRLVTLLRTLGVAFACHVPVTRDSPEQEVKAAFRQLARKVHPDKPGGCQEDFQRLSAAHDAWVEAVRGRGKTGRPPKARDNEDGVAVVLPEEKQQKLAFRVQAQAVLLTYQGIDACLCLALSCWTRFLDFVRGNLRDWGVKYWTATLETNKDGKHHLHLMLDFWKKIDRAVCFFEFEGCRPNARTNDLLGEAWCGKRWRVSVDRGHFYVWANKKGTVRDKAGNLCVAANYEPAWTSATERYDVRAEWPEKLWKAYKLDDRVYYDEYLFLCKDKLLSKKRNFETWRAWHRAQELNTAIEQRTQRIRSDRSLYQPFGKVPQAEDYLALFKQQAMRYPVLLVHAPSYAGKSEWAVSLFERPLYLEIGALGLWPPGMKQLDRRVHDGLVLDDLRDLEFIHANQEKLQGKYNRPVTLFNTPGGELAYTVDLYRLPIVFTINNSTKNLGYLASHDFCKRKDNVRLLCFRGRPGQSLVTETLPEAGEEEGAWDHFVSETLVDDDEGQPSSDPHSLPTEAMLQEYEEQAASDPYLPQ